LRLLDLHFFDELLPARGLATPVRASSVEAVIHPVAPKNEDD
jgi:hypothetical protein